MLKCLSINMYFQILVLEPSKEFMPSYVNVNLGAEEKLIHVWNVCMENMKGTHKWCFTASMIRGVRYMNSVINKY